MSDKKARRSVQDITKEYSGLCFKAGNLQYSINALEDDLKLINKEMRDLNLEAASSKAAEDAEKASVAATVSPSVEI